MKQLCVLGSTGSIGKSTLDVVALHPSEYQVFALTAQSSVDLLVEQCRQFKPRIVVIGDVSKHSELSHKLKPLNLDIQVLSGKQSIIDVAAHPDIDIVMAAIVGAAGLLPTLSAVEAGKKVLLANKEALVMAGALFMDAVASSGSVLLPIDSEHNAIFQCLPSSFDGDKDLSVRKILLSGSGGPFRSVDMGLLPSMTPEQACKHPNWSMGRKISVDSATMMNKGLELIEACWLFGVSADKVEIIVHPQSIIHSMVEYVDGSVLAQLGNPDMRTPIAHALAWPQRIESGVSSLDLIQQQDLAFEAPDFERFRCLQLAVEAAQTGQSAPIILNAANEVAVDAFLKGEIKFTDIASIVGESLEKLSLENPVDIAHVCAIDQQVRDVSYQIIKQRCH